MQIKSCLFAVGTFVYLSGAICSSQALGEDSKFDEDATPKIGKRSADVAVRNTRPSNAGHKDARACLDATKNEKIIKCANRYR